MSTVSTDIGWDLDIDTLSMPIVQLTVKDKLALYNVWRKNHHYPS